MQGVNSGIFTLPGGKQVSVVDPHGGFIMSTEWQNAIHEGRAFSCGGYDTALAGSGKLKFLCRTTTAQIHLEGLSILASAGGLLISIYKNPTVDADGTPLTPYNMNEAYEAEPSTVSLFSAPTVQAGNEGTLTMPEIYIPATGVGVNVSDKEATMARGKVFDSDADHLVVIENKGTLGVALGWGFFFHKSDKILAPAS
jgi:hypothetical protein